MNDDKTPEIEAAESEGYPATLAELTEEESSAPKSRRKSSTSAPTKEPTRESAASAASAKPAAVPSAPNAAVSGAKVDPVLYSRAVPAGKTGPRRSLTVYHVQRRLAEHGHVEAWSETRYGQLTERSVADFQRSRDESPTGILTRAQFEALFEGDPNVELIMDTIGDHDGSMG